MPYTAKDRTMNAFTHTVDGGNEFTFVVSRASANADDKVHAVAARTLRELKDTLTDFYLESTQMLTVDGYPAVELFYQFKNDYRVIFQRQTLILLDAAPAGKKLVSYVATCPGEFNERHQQQYQEIIQSIKFHRGK
ncbi:DcrB-related protein [Phytobacter ursingii]|uniref:DcrB-related protein n=1 Tax=Phytobacter ursingii TaxID=1972431 RepID=A0AB35RQV3_9ENTR|nr:MULTISPECIES: DcrB-related protein [Enterobacteriaceae]MDV2864514.1 DcrB-related protein [Phytobacter ursingii]